MRSYLGYRVSMLYLSVTMLIQSLIDYTVKLANEIRLAVIDFIAPVKEGKGMPTVGRSANLTSTPFSKGWMYDMFSRQRVDPAV